MVSTKAAPLKKSMYPSIDDRVMKIEHEATVVTAQIIDETTETAINAKVPTITSVSIRKILHLIFHCRRIPLKKIICEIFGAVFNFI
ncbi:hypothetical protein [Methanobrevibacter sp.]|uniref:hypothetical protein n=1 Tax=Methanobrevibacter sp. TaxID=66852 RepID=UPI00388E2D61